MGNTYLITGGTGYLGSALIRHARARGLAIAATFHHQTPPVGTDITWYPLDLRDPTAVRRLITEVQPAVIIHTAFRQYEPDLMAITGEGAGHVAVAAAEIGARLIHMSSDVIFDGEKAGAYTEADPPNPITDYGRAKARAEELVQHHHPHAAIVRTSLIYGFDPLDRHSAFALAVARGERPEKLFRDELRCPIFVDDLATALLDLAQSDYRGIIHFAGAETISRYEWGRLLAQAHGLDPDRIIGALSAESPTPRPRNCALDISRALGLGYRLRGVSEVFQALGKLKPSREG
ncbi:MAG: NAD(P)-dependent oxidoreductase [Chloroflexus sp.]|uniref:SDR family oxidoreductase n=1 Tax=Chloroflexus sp. TaxID=1904827 RepID=UPI0021DB83E4|nr:SDR family oxidoreductase [Chloroflexus sp.]GIV90937.1 MAG: NAD(P)-dependent oxidoreductase [Chloroflexus sp.]